MNEHDEVPEDAAYLVVVFDGVTHRVPVTPDEARRWLEGRAGAQPHEPFVD